MKKLLIPIFSMFFLLSCSELQQVIKQLPDATKTIGNAEIASALRQALNFGIEKQVSSLTQKDGFFRNEVVKILLPKELQKVDKALRKIGLKKVADEGLRILNRAAEDAVKEATPIFVNAVKGITFDDAKNILLGADNAATQYLESRTNKDLYAKFNPVIQKSFSKVGADKIWKNLIKKYNTLPFANDVNPNLTDYVTQEALKGVFTMISIEEKEIRSKVSSRTTNLLRKVFALQDKK